MALASLGLPADGGVLLQGLFVALPPAGGRLRSPRGGQLLAVLAEAPDTLPAVFHRQAHRLTSA